MVVGIELIILYYRNAMFCQKMAAREKDTMHVDAVGSFGTITVQVELAHLRSPSWLKVMAKLTIIPLKKQNE